MNLLILVEKYLESRYHGLTFVHSRLQMYPNIYKCEVLCFAAEESYEADGIKVWSLPDFYQNNNFQYDILISHAPNLRNHFRFMLKHWGKFSKVICFFHGHEVMLKRNYYPKKFPFVRKNLLKELILDSYDLIKVSLLRLLLNHLLMTSKLHLVFVSGWLKNAFKESLYFESPLLESHSSIINNPVNQLFLPVNYQNTDTTGKKVLVLRPFDESKYAVDIAMKVAEQNPDYEFHLYGSGEFFNHYPCPKNVIIKDKFFKHHELIELMCRYSIAVMPTRQDTQGVLVCEMATLGMPVITSDIEICREMLSGYRNVFFMKNEGFKVNLSEILGKIEPNIPVKNKNRFGPESTTLKEIELIKRLMS